MSLWNCLACSIHSEFLQQYLQTEPNLTFIMAQEKHLPNGITSLHATEIKSVISNRNNSSNMMSGGSFRGSMEQSEEASMEAMDIKQRQFAHSRRRQILQQAATFQECILLQILWGGGESKHMSLEYLDSLTIMKQKNDTPLYHTGSCPKRCVFLFQSVALQGKEFSRSSYIQIGP